MRLNPLYASKTKTILRKDIQFYLEIITWDLSMVTLDHLKFIEESIWLST